MRTELLKSTSQIAGSIDSNYLTPEQIPSTVEDVVAATQFVDIHTHLFAPAFGKLGLWGIDELLTYHYLEAEFFRSSHTTPEEYWSLSKRQQADAIWRTLFVENTPVSEATRGVISVLKAFQLPTDHSSWPRRLRPTSETRCECVLRSFALRRKTVPRPNLDYRSEAGMP